MKDFTRDFRIKVCNYIDPMAKWKKIILLLIMSCTFSPLVFFGVAKLVSLIPVSIVEVILGIGILYILVFISHTAWMVFHPIGMDWETNKTKDK